MEKLGMYVVSIFLVLGGYYCLALLEKHGAHPVRGYSNPGQGSGVKRAPEAGPLH
jgi:hypothetical protein